MVKYIVERVDANTVALLQSEVAKASYKFADDSVCLISRDGTLRIGGIDENLGGLALYISQPQSRMVLLASLVRR